MNVGKTIVVAMALLVCSSARGQTEGESCAVEHPHAENGATIAAKMSVMNDGTPCVMRMRLGAHPATSLTVRARPASGTLVITNATVSYAPNPGFVGKDAFDVQWFSVGFGPNSKSHNLRTKVEVTVRAPSDEPGPKRDEVETKSVKPGM